MLAMHILIATPCYGGQITAATAQSLLSLERHRGGGVGTDDLAINYTFDIMTSAGESLITRARNGILSYFWHARDGAGEPRYTHLLFVDADVVFEPTHVDRLAYAHTHLGVEMSCLTYPLKAYPLQGFVRPKQPIDNHGLRNMLPAERGLVDRWETHDPSTPPPRFTAIHEGGTGFMMISRDAVTEMIEAYDETKYYPEQDHRTPKAPAPEPCWALFESGVMDVEGVPRYMSEDYWFIRRWQSLSVRQTYATSNRYEVWTDLDAPILRHVGQHVYGESLTPLFR